MALGRNRNLKKEQNVIIKHKDAIESSLELINNIDPQKESNT